MAASNDPSSMTKCILENTTYEHHIRLGFQATSIVFEIKIDKFSMMKEDTVYTVPLSLSYGQWIMHAFKKEKTVTITVRTFSGCVYDMKCNVVYGNDVLSKPVYARNGSDGKHVMEISPELIDDPRNLVLKKDRLFCELHIKYRTNSDLKRFRIELIEMLEDIDFTDVAIKTVDDDQVVYVHKSIVAARSSFFFDYLEKNPDPYAIILDTSVEILKLVLQYMYIGTFEAKDIPTMLKLIKLAKQLQMKRLYEICCSYVKDSIDGDNVDLIREIGCYDGEDDLVSACDEFLARK